MRRGVVTRNDLRTRFRAVYRDVYLLKGISLTPVIRARAAWLATGGPLASLSAAAVLGTRWLDPDKPAEIIRADRHAPPGMVAHSWELEPDDCCVVVGMRVTTPARTAFDIGRTRRLAEALPVLDALFAATGIKCDDVAAMADKRPGTRGVRLLRNALELVDSGAESPQESRVRLLLIEAGLPRPETQIEFLDEFGHAFIRVDMGWREWKVAVEYDGVQHWANRYQRSWDIERIALLEAMGWTVIRVSAEMLSRPHIIVERVRAKLRAAGCPV